MVNLVGLPERIKDTPKNSNAHLDKKTDVPHNHHLIGDVKHHDESS